MIFLLLPLIGRAVSIDSDPQRTRCILSGHSGSIDIKLLL